jgi:hypothetical protein
VSSELEFPGQPIDRDYAADMRKYLDEYRVTGTYNAVTAANEIAKRLLHEDRELYYGWLEAHAISTIRVALVQADAATRSHARTTTASVFAAAARAAEEGNPQPLKQGFLQAVYVIDGDRNRKQLKDMKADDLNFAAATYEDRARTQMFEAAFLRSLAKRVGFNQVGDVFDNITLSELHSQITGN